MGLAVAMSTWVGVAFHYVPWAVYDGQVWRGTSTLTYPSAAGLVIALSLLVALESARGAKAKVAVVYALCVGLVSTGSRGALLAAGGGIVVYGVLRGIGKVARPMGLASCGVIVASIGLLPSMT